MFNFKDGPQIAAARSSRTRTDVQQIGAAQEGPITIQPGLDQTQGERNRISSVIEMRSRNIVN